MRSTILAGFAVILLLIVVAVPVSAKEAWEARFDAPIAMGTPAGTELLVGVTVTVADGEASRPVEGSPIYLLLTGRDGATTRAAGEVDGKPGHYLVRIAVPAGGARETEVGIHGTTDLPIRLIGDPFAPGGISPSTAQVAPALPPAMTPLPRASLGAAAPVQVGPVQVGPVQADVEAAPLTDAGPATEQPLDTAPVLPVLLAIGFAGMAGLLVILAIRRSRASATLRARHRTPGA